MNRIRNHKILIFIFIGLFLLLNYPNTTCNSQEKINTGQTGIYKNGVAASAHPLATKAAFDILKMGGNAVDAAVAAAFTIGVVEPDGSGIGGGGAMIVYISKEKKTYALNYYPKTSEKADKLDYSPQRDNKTVKAVTIPGTVSGLIDALEKFGTLPLATVIAPAIKYAEEGFPIDGTLASILLDHVDLLQQYPSTANIFLKDGFPLMKGDTLYQKDLAKTLKKISIKGKSGFYEGEVAENIVKEVTEAGGMLSLNDLKNYKTSISEPVSGSYRGYKLFTAGIPLAGVSIIEALNILENKDLKSIGHFSANSDAAHILSECLRRVYADRSAFIGDPNFEYVPVKGLLSKEYAAIRFKDITDVCNPPEYRKTKEGNPSPFDNLEKMKNNSDENKDKKEKKDNKPESNKEYDGHTTHLCVIDKDGNMVSLTQTLGTFFGSGFVSEGVLLNSVMSNFSEKMKINKISSLRQPRSSISPTLIFKDDKPFAAVGSPGATRIVATVVQLIMNLIDYGMSAEEANKAPRLFCQKSDEFLHLEGRFSPEVISSLKNKGHKLRVYGDFDLFFGGAQLITINPETGEIQGSADIRRGGTALGY